MNKLHRSKRKLRGGNPGAAVVILAAVNPATAAYAQETTRVELAPLTVYGEKLAKPLDETASSVSVVTEKDIEQRQTSDLFDVIDRTANAGISRDRRSIVLRGIPKDGLAASEDVLTQSQGDVVTTYLDGVPISTWAGPTSTWDMQQIEVFRGPQTTNLGRGSLGGAVVMKSIDPTFEMSGAARGAYGSRDTYTASAAIGGPLVPDRLAARISVDQSGTDGATDNPAAGVNEDIDRHLTLRGKLLFLPADDASMLLSYTHSDRTRGGGLVSLAAFPQGRVNPGNVPERIDKTVDALALDVKVDMSAALRLEALTAFGSEDATRRLDGDQTALELIRALVSEDLIQVSQEAKLVWKPPAGDWSAFGGVYARWFDRSARNDIDASGPFAAFTSDRTVTTRASTLAAFGEVDVGLSHGFRLSAGGRYEAEFSRFRFDNNLTGANSRSDEDFGAFLPKVVLSYAISEEATAAAMVQRGYRAGGAGQSLLTAQQFSFDPEYTWNYELSLRSSFFDNRASLRVNTFYVDWRQQQVQALTALNSSFDTTIVNAGKSTLYGAEAELALQATRELRLSATAGYLHTRFDEFTTAGQDFSGNRFPFAPRLSAGLNGTYTLPGGLMASAGATWVGPYYSDAANTPADRIDGRVIVDAKLGYDFGTFSAALFARNLFAKDYLISRTTSSGTGAAGEPQIIGAILTAKL